MSGWIKIHREIFDHWVSQDPVKFKWWLILLSEVNFSENKTLVGNKLTTVSVGSSVYSLRTWALKFNCGVKSVVSFFELLEKDGMISRETIGKGKQSTTLINITNYARYQVVEETLMGTPKGTPRKRQGHTTKESKESKEREEEDMFADFIETFNMILGKSFKSTDAVFGKFKARLKEGYTPTQMLEALENAKKHPYHIETKFHYLTPEFITRPDKIELYKNHE